MRLSKPKFHEAITMAVDPADEFAADIAQGLQNFTGQESAEIPLTNFLMAPQSIEFVPSFVRCNHSTSCSNIYLGETFSFYLTVLNSTEREVCTSVTVQVRLFPLPLVFFTPFRPPFKPKRRRSP